MTDGEILTKIAFQEWDVHQEIIGRKEILVYRMRTWLYTLSTAVIIAYNTEKITISKGEFLLFAFITICLFYIMEIFHRIPAEFSMERVSQIAEALYGVRQYDGPHFFPNDKNNPFKESYECVKWLWRQARVYLPYLSLIVIFTCISILF